MSETEKKSEDLRKEFSRLEDLRRRTIVRYGPGGHEIEARVCKVVMVLTNGSGWAKKMSRA